MLDRLERLAVLLAEAGLHVWIEQGESGGVYLTARLPGSPLGVSVQVRDGVVLVLTGGPEMDLGRDLREAAARLEQMCSPQGMAAALWETIDQR